MLEAVEGGLCLLEVSDVLDALDVMRCMLEVVEGELCSLEVTRRVLLHTLEAVEGEFCLPEVMDVPEVIRCVLLRMLEVVEGVLCLLDVLNVLDVSEVMRCALLCMLEAVEFSKFAGDAGRAGRAGGDALCADAGGCRGWALLWQSLLSSPSIKFLAHGPNLHQHPPSQAAAPTTTTVSIQDDATTTIYELTGHRQNGWVVRRGRSKRSPTERKPRTVAI